MTRKRTHLALLACLIACLAQIASAADWPTYRHDVRRSGVSPERLSMPLSEHWTYRPAFAPRPAWEAPAAHPIENTLERPRVQFDDAFHAVAAGGAVYFGSSSENKVVALDAATGAVRWQFYTDAAVRLAPTVAGGKVYVGCDDGRAYCLDARTGKRLWVFQAAPAGDMVLGNGAMVSLWPVRTGVVVDGGAAYFGAGVFPSEGVFLYAVGADDGRLLWKNDTYDNGGQANISPQGYLLASGDRLFMPTGRTMPAAFARGDGRFLFQRNLWRASVGLSGGTYNVLDGELLINATEQVIGIRQRDGAVVYTEGRQQRVDSAGSRRLAVADDAVYMLTGLEAVAVERANWPAALRPVATIDTYRLHADALERQIRDRKAASQDVSVLTKQLAESRAQLAKADRALGARTKWRFACTYDDELIAAANVVFVGGPGEVVALDRASGRKVWSAAVHGRARGLAVAGGRLLVSTDKGTIHCFGPGSAPAASAATADRQGGPDGAKPGDGSAAEVAESVIRDSGLKRGYALVLGGDWRLAAELARRTEMMVYAVEPDEQTAAAARLALARARLYGGRVVVLNAPLEDVPYADYFANLIIVADSLRGDRIRTPAAEVLRMLKPCGGAAYVWQGDPVAEGRRISGGLTRGQWLSALADATAKLSESTTKIERGPKWARITRGRLAGAADWSHQYANPGRTACSEDTLVGGQLRVLWFGRPGAASTPNRHLGAASPLCADGVLFVPSEEGVGAYDAYNGLKLWHRELPGLPLLAGVPYTLAAGEGSLFAVRGGECLRLDAASGRTLKTYRLPGAGGAAWSYVACVDGLLYGAGGTLKSAESIFACDVRSGELRWRHEAKDAAPYSICIDGGRLFYYDRAVAPELVAEAAKQAGHTPRTGRGGKPVPPDVRLVVALDSRTGKELWRRPQYVSDCVELGKKDRRGRPIGVFGTFAGGDLTIMASRGVVLLCGQPWNGHFWTAFVRGYFERRSLIALSADDGRPLWSGRKGYRSRPIIVGDRIIAEPWAHDLKTGRRIEREHPVTGRPSAWQMARPGHHCGPLAASARMLLFRSGVVGVYDLEADYGTAHLGAKRPGCRITCIPAGGLALLPEGSSGCTCPFSLQGTVVLKPVDRGRMWGIYSAPGPMTPVKRLAVNFGAPGDWRDTKGGLWLAYPRPRVYVIPSLVYSDRLILDFKLGMAPRRGVGWFRRNPDGRPGSADDDAVVGASGCAGLTRCVVPVSDDPKVSRAYTVRLFFADPHYADAGRRVFNVLLQNKKVLAALDVAAETGGRGVTLVKEFKAVEAAGSLVISLEPVKDSPLLCGLEILAENP